MTCFSPALHPAHHLIYTGGKKVRDMLIYENKGKDTRQIQYWSTGQPEPFTSFQSSKGRHSYIFEIFRRNVWQATNFILHL